MRRVKSRVLASDKPDKMSQPRKTVNADGSEPWEPDDELRQELGMAPLSTGQELTSSDDFELMHTTPAGAAGEEDDEGKELLLEEVISLPDDRPREEARSASQLARPADPGAITLLETELAGAQTRKDIAVAAVRLAACYARATGIFVLNKQTIAGLCAEGGGLASRIEGVLISTEVESLFSAPLASGRAYRGAPSSSAGDVRLMKALGRSEAGDVLLVPVLVRGRCVNVLYADNGPDRLADTAVSALVTAGARIARAYERLLDRARTPS